ncbi:MAG: DUF5667 domain-containing protein [bacterium]|nr:DUF5667 domain-containing protein [bacterium]
MTIYNNMNDQELIKKLNNLKQIAPDGNWKKSYREILYSQISVGLPANQARSNFGIVWENLVPRQILLNLAKPVWLMSLASVLILVAGLGGVYASKNSKPGDSLYIAKIISEKAQFAMAFNEKDKVKLGVGFAANRAKEITQVLKEAAQTDKTDNDKLATLARSFKKEISQVKNRLTIIKTAERTANSQADEDDFKVFGADSGKNNQRLEIAEPVQPAPAGPAESAGKATASESIIGNQAGANATSTPEKTSPADQALDEAEKLFDEKNYNGTIDKLEQAKQIIDQTENGQVKGASETATSTEEK